eukprot:CAMPEP_0201113432 /NCGR_PEP_ID=MMETSP0812-20130820/77830_1 /ASSEMBLY_ACC=CAM_ASM_000668 /TAXON_ID=98059 /ORGANISM="Dinobryon sp., Strain UTEXLB2267" /LENGTH=230 /DNA_ID=CAMNT_0047376965 /DNA_START=105 /DNA_END=797 /DNA_ORIENTATION=-
MSSTFIVTTLLAAASVSVALNSAPVSRTINSALNVRSKSVPFLDQPPALTGKLAGDVGFDPLGISSQWSDKDWSQQIVPDIWPEAAPRTPITTVEWMRESELKHGRFAMLAVLGWVAVDSGLRFPGETFSAIPNSLAAHNAAVENGSMGFLLSVVGILELLTGAAVFDQAKGSGRAPGDFSFDPLGLGKDPKSKERYATNEIKNGRLAMLAFSGIVTQAALFPEKSFPFF